MGSDGSKARKQKHPLPKVPRYEEANQMPVPGASGGSGVESGRFGHGSDHHHSKEPGPFGSFFLRLLGRRPKDPGSHH
jgi:hypothetical protein